MSSIINATTTAGVTVTGDNSGSLQLATNNGTTAVTIDTSQNVGIGLTSPSSKLTVRTADGDGVSIQNAVGTAYRWAVNNDNSFSCINTGVAERMRIDSSGNVGIGTSSPAAPIDVVSNSSAIGLSVRGRSDNAGVIRWMSNDGTTVNGRIQVNSGGDMIFQNTNSITERMRITSAGELLVGKTSPTSATVGCEMRGNGIFAATRSAGPPGSFNRTTDDGDIVSLQQDGTQEGSISVSGTTVSYNGGHLSRWSQLPDGSKDDTILKGTVLTNLDDMCVWTKDGEQLPNEQLNKMKVSDVEGDTNVAGVFVNWTRDEDCNSDDMNVAMTGDMIIRIAEGVVVQKGDLLMSAGDGTAKPQGDDIVRSKTVAKVTSNYVTCTYADGSYCVPCVLMAC